MIDQQKQMANAEKMVMAGMKMLYAKETRQMLMSSINADEPVEQTLAHNIAGIMLMLWEKSQGKLPPESIGPAAAMLVYELASFFKQSGKEVSSEQVKEAITLLIPMLVKMFKGKGQQESMPQQGQQTAQMPQQAPAGQPTMQPPQAPQQGGLIAQGA